MVLERLPTWAFGLLQEFRLNSDPNRDLKTLRRLEPTYHRASKQSLEPLRKSSPEAPSSDMPLWIEFMIRP